MEMVPRLTEILCQEGGKMIGNSTDEIRKLEDEWLINPLKPANHKQVLELYKLQGKRFPKELYGIREISELHKKEKRK